MGKTDKTNRVKIEICAFCLEPNQVCFLSKPIAIGKTHTVGVCVNCINQFKKRFHLLNILEKLRGGDKDE